MALESTCEVDGLSSLPWPCQAAILQCLPLRCCLVLGATCKALQKLVQEDVIQKVDSLDLNNLPGSAVSEALAWALRSDLPKLQGINASGHATLEPLLAACNLQVGRARLNQLSSLQLDSLKQLQDKHMELLIPACPNLELLFLPRCSKLTDITAVIMASHLSRLRIVCCNDWSSLTDAGVCALALGCPLLEDISLEGCLRVGSEALSLLARVCPALRRLSIAKSYNVTDKALMALGRTGSGRLQELCVRQCPRVAAVHWLGGCSGLISLDVSGCTKVNADGLRALVRGCGGSLTRLFLSGCEGVAGEVLGDIGRGAPRLEVLQMRGMALRDEHLVELARSCTTLRTLGLAWCTKLTEAGLVQVLQSNPNIKDLDLEGLYNLTDAVLPVLAAATPRLHRLVLRLCNRLSPTAIEQLVTETDTHVLLLSGILDEAGTCELVTRLRRARPTISLQW